ncbi:MAG: hypothetical protein HUK26_06750 [Duodenibacillus sp.]|nr:hypothetical protein [Duodenibacillus sp.]
MKHCIAALCAGLLMTGAAQAGQYATALGECIYKNSTAADRDTLTQWAYVTLGNTEAGRQIQAVPADKTQQVNAKAKQLVSQIVLKSCSKESVAVLSKEPRTGAQDAALALVNKMVSEKFKAEGASLISLGGSGGSLDSVGSGLSKAAGKVSGLFKK